MADEKLIIRGILRHYWKKGLTAAAAAHEINDVEGQGNMTKMTASRWFKRFNDGDTTLEDKPRSGRPSSFDEDTLREQVE